VAGVGLGVTIMPLFSRGFTNIFDYLIPVTLGAVFLMAAVIFTASYLPSRRAIALEPGDALRYE
jgi:ABC-type lipoprotein release transport system permease subunit